MGRIRRIDREQGALVRTIESPTSILAYFWILGESRIIRNTV